MWAGPLCGLQFAQMGAEGIRVESSRHYCPSRRFPPWADKEPGLNRSGYFNQHSQGKRAIQLNIATEKGAEIGRRLISTADVVIENYAPGVMDRLALGYRDLRRVKPDIIMVSISGYGQTGPDRSYVANGPTLVALSGLSGLVGEGS